MSGKSDIIESALTAVIGSKPDQAANVIRTSYPFVSPVISSRKYTTLQMMKVFMRDGFIDRYSGQRLVFPPVLRLISESIPKEFPFHRN